MRPIVAVLIVALLALVGCGQSNPAGSPAPRPTGTPSAVAYADPAAVFAAIQKAGAPKVEGLGTGDFSEGGSIPGEAHAKRGNFMVAITEDRYMLYLDDGTPATSVVAAVFPDAASRRLGVPFGQHMADALGWPSVWQLQGPNWLIWSTDAESLRGIQGAIGGALGRTPTVTASPGSSA